MSKHSRDRTTIESNFKLKALFDSGRDLKGMTAKAYLLHLMNLKGA